MWITHGSAGSPPVLAPPRPQNLVLWSQLFVLSTFCKPRASRGGGGIGEWEGGGIKPTTRDTTPCSHTNKHSRFLAKCEMPPNCCLCSTFDCALACDIWLKDQRSSHPKFFVLVSKYLAALWLVKLRVQIPTFTLLGRQRRCLSMPMLQWPAAKLLSYNRHFRGTKLALAALHGAELHRLIKCGHTF